MSQSEDSFRSDLVDLLSIYSAVDKVGVNRVGIADTVGTDTENGGIDVSGTGLEGTEGVGNGTASVVVEVSLDVRSVSPARTLSVPTWLTFCPSTPLWTRLV
jgi:hypothetical protein